MRDLIEAIRGRYDAVSDAQLALVRELKRTTRSDDDWTAIEAATFCLSHAYRDSSPDIGALIVSVESLQTTLQAAFDGRLECTSCACIQPCERLAALGIRPTPL